MLFVIFTYDREAMLLKLIDEIDTKHDYIIIDDGSDWTVDQDKANHLFRTIHEGKQGFWKKWLLARQIALGTDHEYFCFLPDDVSNIDLKALETIKAQGWNDRPFALNLINCGGVISVARIVVAIT